MLASRSSTAGAPSDHRFGRFGQGRGGLSACGGPPLGGVEPEAIVAFTFTERAAAPLKSRIEQRILADSKLGQPALDRLGAMFVGTIHSYCFQILQQHVPKYEVYDVLDDNRLIAFLTREAYEIGINSLVPSGLFRSIECFLTNLDVVENELLEPVALDDPFRSMYERYLTILEDNHLLTYGQIVAQSVRELRRPAVFEDVHGSLRHLIVDEYQDVNPAQEALVARLAESPVHLCVVGDDDQSIYQWRGSNVGNIVGFERRYENVKSFKLETNRRSRPSIIDHANELAAKIEGGLEKTMEQHRDPTGGVEVVCWCQATPTDELA